jgi:hypothetical protein
MGGLMECLPRGEYVLYVDAESLPKSFRSMVFNELLRCKRYDPEDDAHNDFIEYLVARINVIYDCRLYEKEPPAGGEGDH